MCVGLLMILGLLGLVLYQGIITFWPRPVVRVALVGEGPDRMGEVARAEPYDLTPAMIAALPAEVAERARAVSEAHKGRARRQLLRVGNFEFTGEHYLWVNDFAVAREDRPEWAVVVERLEWGRFYGFPTGFLVNGRVAATDPAEVWALFEKHHAQARRLWTSRRRIETVDVGRISRGVESARLALRQIERDHGKDSPRYAQAAEHSAQAQVQADSDFALLREEIARLKAEDDRYQLRLKTADGQEKRMNLSGIVRAYMPNRMSWTAKAGVYFSRWKEFLSAQPREANSEGGVWPAIFGTVVMTLLMSLVVAPFGVLAALYLREYARGGFMVSLVRIAVNNLAGVPSIVFGVFGLGFFCYIVGGGIDQIFFESSLPTPTFGTGGILWASLTLALLTLPVVIVATEEALSAVPNSTREGSYACGASKWQTIRRVVLPRALPGIMTGMILAVARGAGEVAPLMLVGAVKLAPDLPVDGVFPYLHPQRSFMHLGFHIYDLGFQSPNAEAAKPMVFTTTLLLIAIVAVLNIAAIRLRTRLRRRFVGSQF